MRIGEVDDSIGREFSARREAMASELRNLGTKLAEPVPGATAPAVPLTDSVHISPEARAAVLPHLARRLPLGPFPSPAELVAALDDIVSRPPGNAPAVAAAVERLVELVRQLANSMPRVPASITPGPADAAAAALVREALSQPNTGPSGSARTESLARLVRELFAALPPLHSAGAGSLRPLTAERAAVAILTAVMTGETGPPAAPFGTTPESGIPMSLLSLLADARPSPRRPGKRKPAPRRQESEAEHEHHLSPDLPTYRDDSRRT